MYEHRFGLIPDFTLNYQPAGLTRPMLPVTRDLNKPTRWMMIRDVLSFTNNGGQLLYYNAHIYTSSNLGEWIEEVIPTS